MGVKAAQWAQGSAFPALSRRSTSPGLSTSIKQPLGAPRIHRPRWPAILHSTESRDGMSLGQCTVHPLSSQPQPKAIPAWRCLWNNTEPRQEEHELQELAQVRGQNSTGLGAGCGLNMRAWLNFLQRDNGLWVYLFIPGGKFLPLTHSRFHTKHIIYYCIKENNHPNTDNRISSSTNS